MSTVIHIKNHVQYVYKICPLGEFPLPSKDPPMLAAGLVGRASQVTVEPLNLLGDGWNGDRRLATLARPSDIIRVGEAHATTGRARCVMRFVT